MSNSLAIRIQVCTSTDTFVTYIWRARTVVEVVIHYCTDFVFGNFY